MKVSVRRTLVQSADNASVLHERTSFLQVERGHGDWPLIDFGLLNEPQLYLSWRPHALPQPSSPQQQLDHRGDGRREHENARGRDPTVTSVM
jgi:hypothetical protein